MRHLDDEPVPAAPPSSRQPAPWLPRAEREARARLDSSTRSGRPGRRSPERDEPPTNPVPSRRPSSSTPDATDPVPGRHAVPGPDAAAGGVPPAGRDRRPAAGAGRTGAGAARPERGAGVRGARPPDPGAAGRPTGTGRGGPASDGPASDGGAAGGRAGRPGPAERDRKPGEARDGAWTTREGRRSDRPTGDTRAADRGEAGRPERAPRRYAPGPGLDRADRESARSTTARPAPWLTGRGPDRAADPGLRPGSAVGPGLPPGSAAGPGPAPGRGTRTTTTRTGRVAAHTALDDIPPPSRRAGGAPRRASAAPPVRRRRAGRGADSRRSLRSALLAAAASTVVPGTGLLMIRHRRAGTLVLGIYLLVVLAMLIFLFNVRRTEVVSSLLSSRVLLVAMVGLLLAALAWIGQIARTWVLARPRRLSPGSRAVGVAAVTAMCLAVATPFGYAANLANSQRSLLDTLFSGDGGGTSAADAIAKPRLNVLLVGSDAGPDRTGARTDTMMVASIDTRSARTTLFALPRNIGYARFPPGTPMAKQFPTGFRDPNGNPLSGDYLLNAVYAYALEHPTMAPAGPTKNPGLNALHETIAYMLGLDLDYYVEVNMAGFASIIDAVGGVTVDVGPTPLPIGGVLPDGTHVKPDGYIPAGVQHLGGDQALWFARSRRDSDDYNRMGRQRCLLQSVLAQKSPTDVITNFEGIARAATSSVSTNIPQAVLGQLVGLVGEHSPQLASISFDPNLPDPNEPDGKFNPSRVDVNYMRQVVRNAFTAAPAPTPAAPTTAGPTRGPTTKAPRTTAPAGDGTQVAAQSAAPEPLATTCG